MTTARQINQEATNAHPDLLGAGKRLFSDTDKDEQNLTLIESESYANGIQKLVYDIVR